MTDIIKIIISSVDVIKIIHFVINSVDVFIVYERMLQPSIISYSKIQNLDTIFQF